MSDTLFSTQYPAAIYFGSSTVKNLRVGEAIIWPRTPTPTPSLSISATRTPSITPTITPSLSISATQTPSTTPSLSISATRTPSITPSITPSTLSPCDTSIIGYWKFDETSGSDLLDSSGNGFTGNLGLASRTSSGKINYGLDFNGTSGEAYIPYSSSLVPTGNTFTISFWIKFDVIPAGSYNFLINFSHGDTPYWQWMVYLSSANPTYMIFGVHNTSGTRYIASTNTGQFSIDTWYHIVCVCPGTSSGLLIYRNGSNIATTSETLSGSLLQPDGDLMFGSDGYMLNGQLDEFGFWERALSSDDITYLYNSGSGRQCFPS